MLGDSDINKGSDFTYEDELVAAGENNTIGIVSYD